MNPPPHDVDLFDPEVLVDPTAAWDRLRESDPVHEMAGGLFVVTRHAAVAQVRRDPDRFTVAPFDAGLHDMFVTGEARARFEDAALAVRSPLATPPAQHAAPRRAVDAALGGAREARPFVRAIADDLLLRLGPEGECELLSDFCAPLSLTVAADRLGLPLEDLPRLSQWAEAWVRAYGYGMVHEVEQRVADEVVALRRYLSDAIDERRAAPRRDGLGALADSGLAAPALVAIAEQLLVGGSESTTHALASGVRWLVERPELASTLRADPSAVPAFVEETLRLETPTRSVVRRAAEDALLCEVKVPAGRDLALCLGAANRDPRVFPDPARLDLSRANAGDHLAFGGAAHDCPGAALARVQLAVGFEALLERWSFDCPVPPGDLAWAPSFTQRALLALPLRYRTRS
ncbi:MAG: cytochrome P450 [Myxococcota bacterium]